ncbi:MAG: SurA N-terminal domain-containing protein, partial [Planctomycetota bacterium]
MRIDRPAGAGPALRREALLPRLLRLIIAIIALAAIACCCGLRSLPAQEGRHFAGGGFAAIANGEPITVFELEEALQQQLATMQQQIPPEALKEARRKLRAQVLDHLILRKLLLQHCDRKKIEVHPQEVEGWVQQRVQQLQEEGYGIQDAADFFRGWKESTGESEEEARKSIADEMRIGRLVRSQIQREEYVSPAEMRSFYRAHPEMFT